MNTSPRRSLRGTCLAVVVALASMLLLQTGVAGAARNDSFGVEPTTGAGAQPRTYFIYNLDPGQSLQDSVTVSNFTDAPITFDFYPTDAQPTPDGGFALGKPDDPNTDVGEWVQLPTDQLTVPPMTAASVPFRITIPSDAVAGDYAGGIVALNTATRQTSGADGGNLDLTARDGVAARIYVRVTGAAQPGLAVSSISIDLESPIGSALGAPSKGTVTYKVVNTGNLRLTPTATLKVAGPFGLGETTIEPRELSELLPGGSTLVTESVDGLWPLGWQTATVEVSAVDSEGTTLTTSGSSRTIDVPWLLLLLILVIVVVVLLLRRRRRGGSGDDTPPAGGSDESPPVGAAAGST